MITNSMTGSRAELLLKERFRLDEDRFVELVIWTVPEPVPGSSHRFKYRLALVEHGICTVRFDNEAGKGDHRHDGTRETSYRFASIEDLQADFWIAVGERVKR